MCGIAGYLVTHPDRASPADVEKLLAPIRIRGPDDEGLCLVDRERRQLRPYRTDRTVKSLRDRFDHFADEARHIPHDLALIHTRFSIIDLSDAGHQPFQSGDASVVAIFNGEIYNYLELREELEAKGVCFRSSSDTEVLVEGYRVWKDRLWPKLNGFWGVALYDFADECLVLSRDRLGVAPLYYRQTPRGLFFSSRIHSLASVGGQPAEPDFEAVSGFIETSLKDFGGGTCFAQVNSLPPGSVARFRTGVHEFERAECSAYWTPPGRRLRADELPLPEAVERYRDTFFGAVDLRMRADVKVAFELSGGLDSSSIVAAASALGHQDITTYTIRVPEADEEPYARAILDKHTVDYRVLLEPEETFFSEASSFTALIEEPYHSPNIYTNFKMRREMKREGMDVVLSGSGGDEMIAGYETAFWPRARDDLIAQGQRTHALTHEWASRFLTPKRALVFLYGLAKSALRVPGAGGTEPQRIPEPGSAAERMHRGYPALSYYEQRLYHLQVGLLPYYLRSNDHFTMAIPMEHRFPFLDYRMVELGLQMPTAHLFKNGWSKYVLRKAMAPYLPEKITWRRDKMGFPFAYKRFMEKNRARLQPLLGVVKAMNLIEEGDTDYDALLQHDAVRLWRICSTGMWLESGMGTP
ncbi:MAG: asparagine synthase (glutamine-hydrolyzing) [Myxococcales bacterium]|nr:asparagine synthase (glutamine-hydrolyzing) [Myxococcales bacterium]